MWQTFRRNELPSSSGLKSKHKTELSLLPAGFLHALFCNPEGGGYTFNIASGVISRNTELYNIGVITNDEFEKRLRKTVVISFHTSLL
jgi:hypothetical protein